MVEKVMLRYEGASHEIAYGDLDLPAEPGDSDIKTAVEKHLELSPEALDGFEIDSYSDSKVIRPQAKFGK